jgi:mannose-6-phosphate isomerase-like protein (cupin superfamily)
MTMRRFEDFEAWARAEGFDEVLKRNWPAQTVLETHTHPFEVKALLVEGEMWLTLGGETRHLLPGDEFAVAHGAPHAERYGDTGATYWVARRASLR